MAWEENYGLFFAGSFSEEQPDITNDLFPWEWNWKPVDDDAEQRRLLGTLSPSQLRTLCAAEGVVSITQLPGGGVGILSSKPLHTLKQKEPKEDLWTSDDWDVAQQMAAMAKDPAYFRRFQEQFSGTYTWKLRDPIEHLVPNAAELAKHVTACKVITAALVVYDKWTGARDLAIHLLRSTPELISNPAGRQCLKAAARATSTAATNGADLQHVHKFVVDCIHSALPGLVLCQDGLDFLSGCLCLPGLADILLQHWALQAAVEAGGDFKGMLAQLRGQVSELAREE